MTGLRVTGIPIRFFQKAALCSGADGNLVVSAGKAVATAVGWNRTEVVVHDPQFIHHYFHFLEIFTFLYAVLRQFTTCVAPVRIVFTSDNWRTSVQEDILRTIFPSTSIESPNNITNNSCKNMIYVDRSLSQSNINKFLQPGLSIAEKWTPELAFRVHNRLGVTPLPSSRVAGLRILYVKRDPPRRLIEAVEQALFQQLYNFGSEIQIIDFAGLSWAEQVRRSADCDAIVGVHGNGLTNLLWTAPHSAVIEFFPENVHHYDYQLFAEISNHRYFGIEARKNGYVHREFSRAGPAYGTPNSEITELPWDTIARIWQHLGTR